MVAFSKPIVGNCFAYSSTSCLRASISGTWLLLTQSLKSLSLGPVFCFRSTAICTALSTNSATLWKSFSTNPLLVSAGLPMRTPPGTMADTSPGTVFLLTGHSSNSRRRQHVSTAIMQTHHVKPDRLQSG
eukprot:GHUV01051501.1.p1 GENE.GHUV01051501.1~~GHUV01051501.1.p1  ORF type:complete len:130 (+),score=8.46 GHUV01051501.1:210-599(+)